MRRVKFGLIGCGRIAQLVHLKILTRLPGVQLIALAEIDSERLKAAGRRVPKAILFTNYHELLAMPEIQAVVICLPNALHAEAALAALEQNKHVYLEKPLATNLEEGRLLLSAWKDSGKVGMIGFNYRFNRCYQKMSRLIRSGEIGNLVSVRSVFSSASWPLPPWKQTLETGGGVLADLAVHHVDLMHFIFGQKIQKIFAQIRSQSSEGDSGTLQLELESGLLIQSFFSLSTVDEDRWEIYARGRKFSLNRHYSFSWRKILRPKYEPSYSAALVHFVESIKCDCQAKPDFLDGYHSLQVIAAAEESVRTGQAVAPNTVYEDSAR